MNVSFNSIEGVWWLTLGPTTARGEINGKTVTIVDFWTRSEYQGQGHAEKLLRQIRKKFKRVIIRGIGEPSLTRTVKAEMFWEHVYGKGLVDELHYIRRKKSVIRKERK